MHAVEAELMQKGDDNVEHPVQYASRKLSKEKKRYGTFGREALAVTCGLKKLRNFLLGSPFTVFSDNLALREAL